MEVQGNKKERVANTWNDLSNEEANVISSEKFIRIFDRREKL